VTGGLVLRNSELYEPSSLSCGPSAYGLQFHVEATEEMVDRWLAAPTDREKQMTAFRHFAVKRRGEVVEIRLGNPTINDVLRYPDLLEELRTLLEQKPPRKLLVSFSAVQYCSSAMISALLMAKKRVESEGGKMKLCGMNDTVYTTFRTLNLEGSVFEIYPSEGSAVEAFSSD
jgi:anti-sigma B factor antagonist